MFRFFFEDPDSLPLNDIIGIIPSITPESVFDFIKENSDRIKRIVTNEIPQFSDFEDVFEVVKIVNGSPETFLTWDKLGYYLCPKGASRVAKMKYGENHYKLAIQLGFAKPGRKLFLTDLGKELVGMKVEEKQYIASLMVMRIPLIQTALINAECKRFNLFSYLEQYLSVSTVKRRMSNIKTLLRLIENISTTNRIPSIIWNIVWDEQDYELSKD